MMSPGPDADASAVATADDAAIGSKVALPGAFAGAAGAALAGALLPAPAFKLGGRSGARIKATVITVGSGWTAVLGPAVSSAARMTP